MFDFKLKLGILNLYFNYFSFLTACKKKSFNNNKLSPEGQVSENYSVTLSRSDTLAQSDTISRSLTLARNFT